MTPKKVQLTANVAPLLSPPKFLGVDPRSDRCVVKDISGRERLKKNTYPIASIYVVKVVYN